MPEMPPTSEQHLALREAISRSMENLWSYPPQSS